MKINTSKLKDQYVTLVMSRDRRIQVKLDDEGVVVDFLDADDEVIDSIWKTYQEMIDGDELEDEETKPEPTITEIDGRYTCTACGYEWSATLGDNEIPEICDCQK